MDIPNYGLISGLADGLKQGLLTYQNQKNIQQQRQMEGAMHGLEQDENGNWNPGPAKQAELQAMQLKNADLAAGYDSSSPTSQAGRGLLTGEVRRMHPEYTDEQVAAQVPETLSSSDIQKYAPLIKSGQTGDVSQYKIQAGNDAKLQQMQQKSEYDKQINDIKNEFLKQQLQTKGSQAKDIQGMKGEQAENVQGMKSDVMDKRLKMMEDMQKQRQDLQEKRFGLMESRLGMSANQNYSKEMHGVEDQLLAANKALSLVHGIQAKDLVGTSQLKADLSSALASMIANKPATVYGMQHQEFDSLWGRAQKALGFLTGETNETITEPQLQQLKKDVVALQKEYGQQREIRWNAYKEGVPQGLVPQLQNRYEKFGQGVSQPAPVAAQPQMQAHPQDSQAVQWAKQNPNDPRSQAILKANGQ